ncbi:MULTISPECIES: hypothetical protein [unclassified Pseudomonas]|uniref:hypothetical protein n=1 Tax=unclassified Pseudomonas TaxID=196821 RepID=UPI0013580E71|nr:MULTISPECIES: hypothetical protein [unclassified Pseudomonas]
MCTSYNYPRVQCSKKPLNLLKPMLSAILFLVISGCAKTQHHEETGNKFSTPTKLPSSPIALIISDSATETIKQLITYNNHYKNSWTARFYMDSIRQAYVETSDPALSLNGVTQSLKKRFGEVRNNQSIEQASRNNSPLIAILDIKTRLINNRSSEPESFLSLEFYTPDGHYLGTVESNIKLSLTPLWTNNKRAQEIVAEIRQQGEIQQQALELLDQRLSKIPTE